MLFYKDRCLCKVNLVHFYIFMDIGKGFLVSRPILFCKYYLYIDIMYFKDYKVYLNIKILSTCPLNFTVTNVSPRHRA